MRHPRRKSEKHLAWLRTLPSLVRGEGPVEAAHIRYADFQRGKRQTGMGEKPDDMWAVPLAASAHRQQHSTSERRFWEAHGIDPILIAAFLWLHSGDNEAGRTIIANARAISS